jgi:hypothetical protein
VRNPSPEMHSSEPVSKRLVFSQSILERLYKQDRVSNQPRPTWDTRHHASTVPSLEPELDSVGDSALARSDPDHFDVVVDSNIPLSFACAVKHRHMFVSS